MRFSKKNVVNNVDMSSLRRRYKAKCDGSPKLLICPVQKLAMILKGNK